MADLAHPSEPVDWIARCTDMGTQVAMSHNQVRPPPKNRLIGLRCLVFSIDRTHSSPNFSHVILICLQLDLHREPRPCSHCSGLMLACFSTAKLTSTAQINTGNGEAASRALSSWSNCANEAEIDHEVVCHSARVTFTDEPLVDIVWEQEIPKPHSVLSNYLRLLVLSRPSRMGILDSVSRHLAICSSGGARRKVWSFVCISDLTDSVLIGYSES